jgi:sodium transport system permease protein
MSGWLWQVWTVLGAEVRLAFRDRRALVSAMLMAVVGPGVFALTFTQAAGRVASDKPLTVAVQGREHAPDFAAYLARSGVTVEEVPAGAEAGAEAAVQEGKRDALLVLPERFGEDVAAARQVRVRVVADRSRDDGERVMRRARALVDGYASMVAAQRLVARGVSPTLVQPVLVEQVDLATPEKLAGRLLQILPLFLIMAAFVGALSVAIDATAGERERASLEPLLLAPVDRRALVAGKWLASVAVGVTAVALCAACFLVALRRLPLEELGLKVVLGPAQVPQVVLAVLPMALLAASAQMAVATFARSFKEAQTYASVLMMVPMLPAMLVSATGAQGPAWMGAVPVVSQLALVQDVLRGAGLDGARLLLSTGVPLLASLLLVGGTAALFGRERIVFGR